MIKVLDERFNEKSGLLEKVVLFLGHKNEELEEYFEQEAEVSIEKQYYRGNEMIYSDELYSYYKHDSDKENTKQIVINDCFGRFDLSVLACIEYLKLRTNSDVYAYFKTIDDNKAKLVTELFLSISYRINSDSIFFTNTYYDEEIEDVKLCEKIDFNFEDIKRDDENLIRVVEELGSKADTSCSDLIIVNVKEPYNIINNDGRESVEEL
jgi:hypothetical protein